MVSMVVDNVLYEYDEPLVLTATDQRQRRYIALNVATETSGYGFFIAYVHSGDIEEFIQQKIDLRHLMRDLRYGKYLWAVLFGELGEHFDAKPLGDRPIEQLLPSPGFFLPKRKRVLEVA